MGKYAMVTGGLKGIGLGITKQLMTDGYDISILGTSPEDMVRSVIGSLPGRAVYTQGDLSDDGAHRRYLEKTLDAFPRVDALVNNAGVAPVRRVDLLQMSRESLERLLSINLVGTTLLTQLVSRHMCTQPLIDGRRGTIMTITSVSAYTASINRGEYCISKAGLAMMTKLFADRLAEEHIPVFEVRPGVIDTDMTAGVHEKYDALIDGGLTPIRRWGLPEDIGRAVSLLCAPSLTFTTGQVLDIDGGFHIRRL